MTELNSGISCTKKGIIFFLIVVAGLHNAFGQVSEFKGVMQIGDNKREDIRVKVTENKNKVSGTIYQMRVAKHLNWTVDVSIDGLDLVKQGNKKYIHGKNITPTVNDKHIDKIKVKNVDGVMDDNTLQFTLIFADKTMKYTGKKL